MPNQVLTNYRLLSGEPGEPLAIVAGRFAVPTGGEETIDLEGKTLLPKWIDNHCHILPTGLDLGKLSLRGLASRETILDAVRDRAQEEPDGWLHAVAYDPTNLPTGEEIGKDDLDQIAGDRPILLRYVSGHASLANSAALRAARIDDQTPDPPGGRYERDADGRLNGTLTEDAHERVTGAMPTPTIEEMTAAILRAGASMADYGIGTASDMMTGRFNLTDELAAYRLAASRGNPIRVRLYIQWRDVFGPRGIGPERLRELTADFDESRVAVRGIKLFADGAIGSATAAIYGRYRDEAPSGPIVSRGGLTLGGDKSGQLIYAPEKLTAMVVEAAAAGFPASVHAIGDYAADLTMDAFAATADSSLHRIEHAMLLSDAQIERLAGLNPFVTFQPEFLVAFDHAYRRRLGADRTSRLLRTRSLLNAGLRLSFSSDRPIVSGDPQIGISAATDRPNGGETVTHAEAIHAYTVGGAEANGDAGKLGTLAIGAFADWRVI